MRLSPLPPESPPTNSEALAPRPLIVGILGGIGSGKSTVAKILATLGPASVLDADREAHSVLDEEATRTALVALFGPSVLRPGAGVDRGALASLVFTHPTQRQALEALVHPRVRERLRLRLDEATRTRSTPFVVLDVPLLIEGPIASWCDVLLFVDTPEQIREARCKQGRGWSQGEVARREAAQADLQDKRQRAHFVIDNSGDRDHLAREVARTLSELRSFRATNHERMNPLTGSLPSDAAPSSSNIENPKDHGQR